MHPRLSVPRLALLGVVTLAMAPAVAAAKKDDAPDVKQARVVAVTPTTASVQADVNTNGLDANYSVQWGTTSAYGNATAEASLSAAQGRQVASGTLAGLTPGTTYLVRIVATSTAGTRAGAETVLTTAAAPPAPVAGGDTAAKKDDKKVKDDKTPAAPAPDLQSGPPATPADAVVGRSVVVGAVNGTINVQVPGADGPSVLGPGAAVPVGSVVDATRGTVRLTSAVPGAVPQDALLRGAKFEVRQARAGGGMTDLVLRGGDFGACRRDRPATARAAASRDTRRGAPRRSLWAKDDSGRFRTRGRHAVATVRGTEWTTTDTCKGTTTRVREGAVTVRDTVLERVVLVRAGESYLARAPRR
ncbi:MAG: hypothetical protein QOG77_385 [Solirubrobacteraceae bacterium]|nr:hypothetical protein [Solirubrobacteraceae bacterium]